MEDTQKGSLRRVLFISPVFPYPLDDGVRIRAYHLIRQISSRGHRVTLLCPFDESENILTDLESLLNIEILRVESGIKRGSNLFHILATLFSRRPFMIFYFDHASIRNKLRALLKEREFDLIYSYSPYLISHAAIISNTRTPSIIDCIDCQSENMRVGFRSSGRVIHKVYWILNYFKWCVIERKFYKMYACVTVTAERDRAILAQTVHTRIEVITQAVDLNHWNPTLVEPIPSSLIFVGTMDAYSNSMAISEFVQNIFPIVRAEIPDAKIFIVGKNPPSIVADLDDLPGVSILGYVDDLKGLLDRCQIVISPLKMATGMQNKILEAMAMNKPIVTTRISLGDIQSYLGDCDAVIVDSDSEFAERIIALLSDKSLLVNIGGRGRTIVRDNFSWDSVGDRLNEIIEETIKSQKRQ